MANTNAATNAESQRQQASGEKDFKAKNKPENSEEIQFFDTTITKLVERENEDGEKEWVEVMSDNLYPGEKLKRAEDEKTAKRKDELARAASADAADKRREAEDEILKNQRDADKK